MRYLLILIGATASSTLLPAQDRGWMNQSPVVLSMPSSSSSSDVLQVRIRDKCDPATFNLDPPNGAGPGTCIGSGNVTFSEFIQELTEDKSVGAWKFNPDKTDAKLGQMTTLENRGGETHTFTNVADFGGGFVPILNQLSGNPTPAPECATGDPTAPIPTDGALASIVPAGTTIPGPTLSMQGERKYQCCIHPWMRITVKVEGKNDKDDGKGKDGSSGKGK